MRFLLNKWFWFNVLIIILLAIILGFATMKALRVYTNHGETITVPNLVDLSISEVEDLLMKQHLDYKIHDSSYVVGKKPMVVLSQNPKPLSKVKEGRRIYLTINSYLPPKVLMPSLRDVSLEQAKIILATRGLLLGKISYKPGLGRNTVLLQLMNQKQIKPGEQVYKGSAIDLVLANGYGSSEVDIPDLYGMNLSEAEFLLQASYLNIGSVHYDNPNINKESAIIYKQNPALNSGRKLTLGEAIDLYLTENIQLYIKVEPDSTE